LHKVQFENFKICTFLLLICTYFSYK